MVLAEFGTGQVFWSMLYFFLFFIWIMLLFRVFGDIFRSHDMGGVAKTIWAARQIVAHGHVMIDGVKTDVASARVSPGQAISFKEGIHKVLRDNMEQVGSHNVPNWLEWNPAQLTGKVNALPTPEDVPFEVNMNLIIEFYR